MTRALLTLSIALVLTGCVRRPPSERRRAVGPPSALQCGDGTPMIVHFYDVGQALAALVELPTGQLVLVDTGESGTRAGCGKPCRRWHEHLMEKLRADVDGRRIDLLWITHPHSDHIGGAVDVVNEFEIRTYADNGALRGNTTVTKTLDALTSKGVEVVRTTAEAPAAALQLVPGLDVRGIVPSTWPVNCDQSPNNCSAGLRIDYCQSSVLFTGDAEAEEESVTDYGGPVTLLQVGHHGSNTSSTDALLTRVTPKWAVISSGKRDEGTNRTYCHPRAAAVARVSEALGDSTGAPVEAFEGASCSNGTGDWATVPSSSRLFVTARDGDVSFATNGDGHLEGH